MKLKYAFLAGLAAALPLASQAQLIPVDLELQLVIDVSGSINSNEFNRQLDGYASAFRQQSVIDEITGTDNGISVGVTWFASSASNDFGTRLLQSETDILNFANELDNVGRPFSGGTVVPDGINGGLAALQNNAYDSSLWIMDVSGDGTSFAPTTEAARDNALANGVDTINGLAFGGQNIVDFYTNSVIGGDGAQTFQAETIDDFEAAVRQKIEVEVQQIPGTPGVPEPSTYGIFGALVLGALIGFRRFKVRA